MTQGDERILEFLHEKEIVASPAVIAANIDYTNEYISRRCTRLADEGFLQLVDPSNYKITKKGRGFLEGELNPENLETEGE